MLRLDRILFCIMFRLYLLCTYDPYTQIIYLNAEKPPFPSKPHAEVEDDESVLLKWTVPSGYSELNYIVERYEPKLDLWVQCNHGILARTSYLITGLLPGKEYKFRVSCENTHGVGLPSEESDPVIIKETEGNVILYII